MPRSKRTRTSAAKLTPEQAEVAAQFADYAFDYPGLSFDEVARKVLPKGFGTGQAGQRFRKEAKEVFERERES
jgi:hypothetical protein